MSYLLIDDGMAEHEKIAALSPAEFFSHFRAMCWSARRGTDGRVPPQAARQLGINSRQVERLVQVGVWDVNGDGWVIHDWRDFNPPTDPAERKKWFARKRQWRHRRALADGEGAEDSWPE